MTLEVKGLSVIDGGRILVAGVDLVIEPGKVTAVIGANGAGKSELVLALAGVMAISAGEVTLDGRRLNGLGPEAIRRAGVAAVRGYSLTERVSGAWYNSWHMLW